MAVVDALPNLKWLSECDSVEYMWGWHTPSEEVSNGIFRYGVKSMQACLWL